MLTYNHEFKVIHDLSLLLIKTLDEERVDYTCYLVLHVKILLVLCDTITACSVLHDVISMLL